MTSNVIFIGNFNYFKDVCHNEKSLINWLWYNDNYVPIPDIEKHYIRLTLRMGVINKSELRNYRRRWLGEIVI